MQNVAQRRLAVHRAYWRDDPGKGTFIDR